MARDYGKIRGRLWNGDTGRALRGDLQAQLVAAYLISCEMSNMIGLYYLPIPMIAHELGIPIEGAWKALRRLSEGGFAHYDEASEVVWVVNMAAEQVGDALKADDKQCVSVSKELSKYRKCRFYMEFYARYRHAFHLPATSPLEGPSEALRRPLEGPSPQEQEQEQEREQEKEQEREQDAAPSPFGNCQPIGELDPGWLTREFLHYRKGVRGRAETAGAITETFAEMIRQGCRPEAIRDEITRKDRTKTEPVWNLEKRLLGKPSTNGAKPQQFSGLREFLDKDSRAG